MKKKEHAQISSRAALRLLKTAKQSLAIDGRGMPRPGVRKAGLPGYADAGTGTPGYIKEAANRAEKLAKTIVKDFACGGVPEPARHRIPDTHWSAGKPDRGREVAINMKPENVAANPDKKTSDKVRF